MLMVIFLYAAPCAMQILPALAVPWLEKVKVVVEGVSVGLPNFDIVTDRL